MPVDFLSLFALLNAQQVRYVLVGGLAVVLHGIDRITADIDLALDLGAESVRDAVSALQDAGFRPMLPVDAKQLADPAVRRIWREERGMQVFSFWDPTHSRPSIDIFVESPIAFADLWRDAIEVTLDGIPLRVASVPHLIALKRIAGRPQDLADIEQLLTLLSPPAAQD
jgi:hypothetical protein